MMLLGEWKALPEVYRAPTISPDHSLSHRLEIWQETEDVAWPTALCPARCHRSLPGVMATQIPGDVKSILRCLWLVKILYTGPQALSPLFSSLQILIINWDSLSLWSYDSWWPLWHGLKDFDSYCILWLCLDLEVVPRDTFLVLCKVVYYIIKLKWLVAELEFPLGLME